MPDPDRNPRAADEWETYAIVIENALGEAFPPDIHSAPQSNHPPLHAAVEGVLAELERRADHEVAEGDRCQAASPGMSAMHRGEAYGLRAAATLLRKALEGQGVGAGGLDAGRTFATQHPPEQGEPDLPQAAPRPESTGRVPDPHHGPSGNRASAAGDLQTEQGEDEDCPAVMVARDEDGALEIATAVGDDPPVDPLPAYEQGGYKLRRYVPAEQVGGGLLERLQRHLDAIYEVGSILGTDEVGRPRTSPTTKEREPMKAETRERLLKIAKYIESSQGNLPPALGGDSAKQDAAFLRSLAESQEQRGEQKVTRRELQEAYDHILNVESKYPGLHDIFDRAFPGWDDAPEPTNGAALIAAERERQVNEEGWTPEHDDQHDDFQLCEAAAAYALYAGAGPTKQAGEAEALWPFEDGWNPSEDEIRNLTKAGALIAAEIDRLQRATPEPTNGEAG